MAADENRHGQGVGSGACGLQDVGIESSRARVIDMAGDSVLALFETATESRFNGTRIQGELQELVAATLRKKRACCFRIGIHLGEVIEKPERQACMEMASTWQRDFRRLQTLGASFFPIRCDGR
jgi:adenylate cyclase